MGGQIIIIILTGFTFGRSLLYFPHKTHIALVFDSRQYETCLGNICGISLKASQYYINIQYHVTHCSSNQVSVIYVCVYKNQ